MYDNMRDVEFRLKGTLVEYKGELRYVNSCSKVRRMYCLELGDDLVRLDSRYLKITDIKTGYMNIGGYLVYLLRRPTRAYRQGLRRDNTDVSGSIGFNEVMEYVRQGVDKDKPLRAGSTILDKDYAVVGGKLFYRTRPVGIYHEGKAYLDNDKKFLVESLGECSHGS